MTKITEKQITQMKKLKEKGKTYQQIADKFNTFSSNVQYHVDAELNKKAKARAIKRRSKLTKKEIKKLNAAQKDYYREYYARRYREDPEYRKKHLERCKKYKRERSKR